MKTWFITGISRGLGLSIAKAALAEGDKVIGTVRGEPPSLAKGDGQLNILKADMADPSRIAEVVHEAFSLAGTIDVVVNNAGFGLLGAVEESTDEELTALFAVDSTMVTSPRSRAVPRASVPHCMRQQSMRSRASRLRSRWKSSNLA